MSKFCGESDILTSISPEDEQARIKMGYSQTQNVEITPIHYHTKDWARLFLKRKRKKYYNHMPASEIKSYVSSQIWNDYFKFCIERNPFDKIVSHYYWAGGDPKFGTIEQYLDEEGYRELKGHKMYTIKDQIAVDQIIRYENLQEELERIQKKLKLPSSLQLPSYKAKSNTRIDKSPYQEKISLQARQKIESLFHWEIQHLGYQF